MVWEFFGETAAAMFFLNCSGNASDNASGRGFEKISEIGFREMVQPMVRGLIHEMV